jgi:hypothetical protein
MTNLYYHSGSLPIESPTYIKRDADSQLFDALKNREFCCLLESRQTGKTSLSFRTGKRLKEVGIFYLYHYMGKNSPKNSEQWYKEQIIAIIVDSLINYKIDLLNENTTLKDVSTKLEKWWEARPGSNLRKYEDFLEGHLLENIRGDIVFCIDEIGSVIEFPFSTDEFFEFIRGCHEDRRSKPQYSRLTFCLIGLASIDDLIRNKNENTPSFNIGTSVTLSPFPTDLNNEKSLKTMQPLLNAGIEDISTFQEILNWTGGQPFLTQKICDLIVKKRQSTHPQFTNVEEVVISEIINNWQDDTHFTTIQTKLVGNQKKAFETLDLYKEILEKRQIEYDCRSEGQTALRLSGLVLKNEGKLKLYNRIYEQIFNPSWVKQEKAKLRLYIEEFDSWNEWEKWKETNNLDYDLQERYLLYGTKCDRVQKWRIKFNEDNGKLYEKEGNFLDRSKTFWREVKNLFSDLQINEGTMESIIQSANDLTGGLHKFNRIVFHIAKNNNVVDLQQDEVQGWLENLVLSNSSNLELFKEYDLFRQDRDQFLNQDDSFELISIFERIAQNEPIRFDEKNSQHRKLKDMCFIILDKEHNLRILNEIYKKILDQNWIKEVMAGLRPYTKAFRDWQHSDRQESSYLLQNNNLKLALEWLGKKPTPTLEEGETEFVMTSLVAEVWTTASPSVQSEAVSLITTFRPSLKGKNNYSDFLLQEILQWTRPEPLLLRELLEVVNKTEIFTTNYHNWIEQLVKTQIINNSQDSKLAEHFRLIEQRLTNHQSSESFWLIVKYRQILLQGKIEFDEIREDTKLIELGLVVKLDHQLEIANPIYENIFDKRWTYQKLSECKRIRAINLLKWCPANIPEQNDPVLRSYLDEWINNNATIIEKIVQEAKGEVLDNKFDFIDEIKLLTYDIMGMRTSDTPQISIQHSLNRIFKDDVKKMAQNNDLDSLLNKIVENATEIEAIVILGLKAGMVSGKNSNLESNNSSLYQIVRSETLVSFAKLKTIPDILDNFGEKTNFGKLSYAMFTLEKGVVISHFTKIQGNPFAICFISNSEVDMPGLFLAQCEGKFEKIQKELEKVLG